MSNPYVRPLGELFKASRPKPVSSATTRRDEKRKDVRHDNQSLASPRERVPQRQKKLHAHESYRAIANSASRSSRENVRGMRFAIFRKPAGGRSVIQCPSPEPYYCSARKADGTTYSRFPFLGNAGPQARRRPAPAEAKKKLDNYSVRNI